MSERTLTAPEAARAAVAAKAAVVPGRTTVEIPPSEPPPPERPCSSQGQAFDAKGRLLLAAKALKVTAVVDPSVFAGIEVVPGQPAVRFVLEAGGRKVTGQLRPKALKKVVAAISVHEAGGVACIVQGKLGAGDVLEDAGIIAQPRARKAESAPETAEGVRP